MSTKAERAAVYLDSDLHEALRARSAETGRSVSDLVNEAVRVLLAEDAEDLEAIVERAAEPTVLFEAFVEEMKAGGKI